MQTFLPYPDFQQSAACLDNKRLGKQRVEALQIYRALTLQEYGWKFHPAVKMWRGYEDALVWYIKACIDEWQKRGFKNTIKIPPLKLNAPLPHWLGDEKFHRSHKSNLLYKDRQFYSQYNWKVSPYLDYVWPEGKQS